MIQAEWRGALLTDEKLLLFLPVKLRTLLEQNENSFQFPLK